MQKVAEVRAQTGVGVGGSWVHPGLRAPCEEALHVIWRIIKHLSRGHFSHETSIGNLFTHERISQPSRGLPRVSSAAPSQASLPCE